MIPSQEDHPLYEVEYIRDLIARRNIALDSLHLDKETVDDLGKTFSAAPKHYSAAPKRWDGRR